MNLRHVLIVGVLAALLGCEGKSERKESGPDQTTPTSRPMAEPVSAGSPASTQPSTRPAMQATWAAVGGESPDYQKLAGPEMKVYGLVGAHPTGQPEKMSWRYAVAVDHPWIAVDSRQAQDVLDRLRGQREPAQFNRTPLLVKGKFTPDPSEGNRPTFVVGWVRELGPDDKDWDSTWPMNLQLLPSPRVGNIVVVAACQAAGPAKSQLGFSGVQHARQKFKLVEVFHGDAKAGQVLDLRYSYLAPNMGSRWPGRDIRADEKVIWVVVKVHGRINGYGTVPDTPNNRKAALMLAERLRTTSAPATQPAAVASGPATTRPAGSQADPDGLSESATAVDHDRFAELVQAMKTHYSDTSRRKTAQGELVRMGQPIVPLLVGLLRNDREMGDLSGWSAEVLAEIGDRRAIEPLVAFMESDAWYVSRMKAAEALGVLGGKQAVPALIRQLGEGRPNYMRAAAAKSLGRMGDSSAVAALIKQLREHEYHRVRMAAAEALGLLRAEEAIAPLIEEIRLRKGGRVSFGKFEKYGDGPLPDEVWEQHMQNWNLDSEDAYCVGAAHKALVRIGPASVKPVISALADVQAHSDWALINALTEIQGDGVSEAILDALKSPSAGVRAGAVRALGLRKEQVAVAPLAKLLDDPEEPVQIQAALALGRLKDKRSLPMLSNMLKNPSFPLRIETARVLAQLGDARAAPAMVEAMKIPTPRYWAGAEVFAHVIGQLNNKGVIPALMAHLRDESLPNRYVAAQALGLLRAREATAVLIASLDDEGRSVRGNSAAALGLIGDAAAVPALVELLSLSSDDDPFRLIRTKAVNSLGQIGDARAAKPLSDLLDKHLGQCTPRMFIRRLSANDLSDARFTAAIRQAMNRLARPPVH